MTMNQTVFIKTTTKITLQILGSRVWLKPHHLSEFFFSLLHLTCKDVAASALHLANQTLQQGLRTK